LRKLRGRAGAQGRGLNPNCVRGDGVRERPDPDSIDECRCENKGEIARRSVRVDQPERNPSCAGNSHCEFFAMRRRHSDTPNVGKRRADDARPVGECETPPQAIIRARNDVPGITEMAG
jgi:hypothetical protein